MRRALWVSFRVLPILAVNLLPLVLILRGVMDTADLLLSYVVWVGVGLVATAVLLRRRPPALAAKLGWKEKAALVVIPLATWAAAAERVTSATEWTWGRAFLSLVSGLILAGSTAWALRYRPTSARLGPLVRQQAWLLLVLVIGTFAGLGAAESYPVLLANGWQPGQVGDAWSFPFGTMFAEVAQSFDVRPELFPAIMIVALTATTDTLLTFRREIATPLP